MPTISVDGSAARLLAQGSTEAPGRCLEHVWIAIGQGNHYLTSGGESAAATAAAVPAVNRNYDIDNIPAGYPIFLDRDVFISEGIVNGNGTAIATDWPRSMQIGRLTVAQRMQQTGESFLFWSDYMGGYTLTSTATADEGTDTPIAPTTPDTEYEDDDMTEHLWYVPAGKASTDGAKTVAEGTAWYQPHTGAPVVALGLPSNSPEYTSMYGKRRPGLADDAFRVPIDGDDVLNKLIKVYGLVTKYSA